MSSNEFTIERKTVEGAEKFVLKGRLDSINATELQYILEDVFGAGIASIILNMTLVEYISSAGIRVILKAYKQAEEAGGQLRIERPSENVKNILGMTALEQMLVK